MGKIAMGPAKDLRGAVFGQVLIVHDVPCSLGDTAFALPVAKAEPLFREACTTTATRAEAPFSNTDCMDDTDVPAQRNSRNPCHPCHPWLISVSPLRQFRIMPSTAQSARMERQRHARFLDRRPHSRH